MCQCEQSIKPLRSPGEWFEKQVSKSILCLDEGIYGNKWYKFYCYEPQPCCSLYYCSYGISSDRICTDGNRLHAVRVILKRLSGALCFGSEHPFSSSSVTVEGE